VECSTLTFTVVTGSVGKSSGAKRSATDDRDMRDQSLLMEADISQDILLKTTSCTWWEWSGGSTLIFWRWGSDLNLARDGMSPFLTENYLAGKERLPNLKQLNST
jgi:hypothetical protein